MIIILNTLINTSYICCNQYIYFDMPPEITPSPCAKCVCGSRLPMSIILMGTKHTWGILTAGLCSTIPDVCVAWRAWRGH